MNSRIRKRVVILISGRGSNMDALIGAAMDPAYPCAIVAVISNRADAGGLGKAQDQGIPTRVVPHADFSDRASHEAALHEAVAAFKPDIICLAGYMRILSELFVKKWKGRILNIHPSLLPVFKGVDTHARALSAGLRIHGCTVHFVTPQMDEGPIIAQAAVPVLTDDDEDSLSRRVLAAEHRLYPRALALVATGQARLSAAHCVFSDIFDTADDAQLFSPQLQKQSSVPRGK